MRCGVDVGGVLLPKLCGRARSGLRNVADLRERCGGLVEGARVWFCGVAQTIGPANIYIVRCVGKGFGQNQVKDRLLDDLITPAGAPESNVVFTDARDGARGQGRDASTPSTHE